MNQFHLEIIDFTPGQQNKIFSVAQGGLTKSLIFYDRTNINMPVRFSVNIPKKDGM